MIFERGRIRQAYFYSCCFVLLNKVLTHPRLTSQSLCIQVTAWSLGPPVSKSTVLGWHLCPSWLTAWLTWHPPACHSWRDSWCVHICLRMERPEFCAVHRLLSSSTFLQEPECLLNSQVTVLSELTGQQESGIHLSPPLHHWVMGT